MDIKINNLRKSYDQVVLDDISLNISSYKSIAIIGQSGCGKSTLLRMMTGIEEVDSGKIEFNKHELGIGDIRAYQKSISMVFQKHNLFPHLTLKDNITMILDKIYKMDNQLADKKAVDLLSSLQLEDHMHKKPDQVSGGQAQRASIARALATDPEIIFMDEPTAALDPILTREVLESVKALKSSGTQFVFVTHELGFAREFADYVVFMEEGKIVEEGPHILQRPSSDVLKHFLENERG
ncbi:amino acid ABC transporter ATP-binding protein [Acidaminobacter sp. JC074]|uniref:amino acid ABC transporter ATP-binding protein n=1 Tax=Acidaminobacter sp. JC074 TaxID=2530199 RepID=UPI001F0DAC80|nr:ATP-binding cassette domain-containing protein [Acidaminobacter sp. JC074]MCH4891129.1 amino acid ABC transporter ATP-binding protein [Acidaminobacter sp. JC074]